MAGSSSSSTSINNTHLQDPNPPPFSTSKPPKSKFPFTHYFISKSLIVILVLLVFSFFPSQVPEFFKKTTIATKLWELFYLLVIGIAVCYGLFSRKMDRVHSSYDDDNVNNGTKETYLSGISHISSIFEDGIQSSYGFDEKDLFEGSGSRLSEFGNGFEKSDEKKLNQYFLGESMVVINDENYVLEQLSKPKTNKQNKSLCLPVRSLGSKSLDSAVGKSSNGDGCDSVVNEDSSVGGNGIKNRKFRGLVPIKLEEKFKETDSDSGSYSVTPLNWRSKSMRLEKREDLGTNEANLSPNSRPVSVGVGDFKGLRSKSMRFSMPTQINKSSETEESNGIETNQMASFIDSKPREYIVGTSSDKNTNLSSKEMLKDSHNHGGYKEILKDFGNHGSSREILKDSGSHGSSKEILKDSGSHRNLKEVLKDSGSHRSLKEVLKDSGSHGSFKETLKDSGSHGSFKEILNDSGSHGSSKEIFKDFGKIKVDGGTLDSYNKASSIESNYQRSSIGASSDMNVDTFKSALGKEEKSDSSNSSPKAAIVANTYKRGKSVRTNRPKEQVVEEKVEKFSNHIEDKVEKGSKLGSDVDLDDIEPHSGEVDRRAEEFIAKFRQQIRLQQVAPSRRLNL